MRKPRRCSLARPCVAAGRCGEACLAVFPVPGAPRGQHVPGARHRRKSADQPLRAACVFIGRVRAKPSVFRGKSLRGAQRDAHAMQEKASLTPRRQSAFQKSRGVTWRRAQRWAPCVEGRTHDGVGCVRAAHAGPRRVSCHAARRCGAWPSAQARMTAAVHRRDAFARCGEACRLGAQRSIALLFTVVRAHRGRGKKTTAASTFRRTPWRRLIF